MTYVLIAIGIIVLIIYIVAAIFKWLGKVWVQTKSAFLVDGSENIYDRNKDIIQKFQNQIYGNTVYNVEDKVRDCIREVAEKEFRADIAPGYREWLSRWETRQDIPKEYLELKNYLQKLFSEMNQSLLSKKHFIEAGRTPCDKGSCIGIINEQGYCNACGKLSLTALKKKLLSKTIQFPSLPTPLSRKQYESIFLPVPLNTMFSDIIDVQDYPDFILTIQGAEGYRLERRLPISLPYPISQPIFPLFPAHTQKDFEFNPIQIPPEPQEPKFSPLVVKWYNYIFFWGLLTLRSNHLIEDKQKRESYEIAKKEYESEKAEIEKFNVWLSELINSRQSIWKSNKEEFDDACTATMSDWLDAKTQWEDSMERDRRRIEQLKSQYRTGDSRGVVEYFFARLDSVPLPLWCPREYKLEFEENAGILLIDLKLPYFSALEVVKESGNKIANKKERKDIINQFSFLIVLRLIWEVSQVDYNGRVGLVACNGYVTYDDPATGRIRQDVILTIAVKPEVLKDIKLDRVDAEVCFRNLKGVAATKISELVPVQPLIRFNKADSRFIAAKEVLENLGDTNLAAMDWQEFEHLIRELFQKEFGGEGAEVKITQASRDRGVDAIAFDPDPLRGGKFVIQAKRYTNPVDVSAVRDLYGTVVNEGANRGILVTTSNYGRDAYDFAKDKPITLLNGENLLHLLQKHGYNMKIDIKEAKRLLKVD